MNFIKKGIPLIAIYIYKSRAFLETKLIKFGIGNSY
jgi:hypothetical protein